MRLFTLDARDGEIKLLPYFEVTEKWTVPCVQIADCVCYIHRTFHDKKKIDRAEPRFLGATTVLIPEEEDEKDKALLIYKWCADDFLDKYKFKWHNVRTVDGGQIWTERKELGYLIELSHGTGFLHSTKGLLVTYNSKERKIKWHVIGKS